MSELVERLLAGVPTRCRAMNLIADLYSTQIGPLE